MNYGLDVNDISLFSNVSPGFQDIRPIRIKKTTNTLIQIMDGTNKPEKLFVRSFLINLKISKNYYRDMFLTPSVTILCSCCSTDKEIISIELSYK